MAGETVTAVFNTDLPTSVTGIAISFATLVDRASEPADISPKLNLIGTLSCVIAVALVAFMPRLGWAALVLPSF